MSFLPFAVAAWLFVVGLYGIVSSKNLVRTIISLTVVQFRYVERKVQY